MDARRVVGPSLDYARSHNTHPFVEMVFPVDDSICCIDEEIAPLIEAIWKLGIRTVNSCQDNRRMMRSVSQGLIDLPCVWINFLAEVDAEKFATLLLIQHTDSHWIDLQTVTEELQAFGAWSASPEVLTCGRSTQVIFSYSFRFDRKYLPLFTKRMQAVAAAWQG